MDYFLGLLINGIVVGSIYSLVALGFVLIYKATEVVNFAQGELLMIGAYICFEMVVTAGRPFSGSISARAAGTTWSFWPALRRAA